MRVNIFIGGMQDYNYVNSGCMEITLELSCCKYPHTQELPRFWMENKKALLAYLGEVHRGVRGLIQDVNGNSVPSATLKIKGREMTFRASNRGEFWRILLPGVYKIEVFADGYHPAEQQFTVQEGQVTYVTLQLIPVNVVSIDSSENSTAQVSSNLTTLTKEGKEESVHVWDGDGFSKDSIISKQNTTQDSSSTTVVYHITKIPNSLLNTDIESASEHLESNNVVNIEYSTQPQESSLFARFMLAFSSSSSQSSIYQKCVTNLGSFVLLLTCALLL